MFWGVSTSILVLIVEFYPRKIYQTVLWRNSTRNGVKKLQVFNVAHYPFYGDNKLWTDGDNASRWR